MTGSREGAIGRATGYLDSGEFLARLAEWVAVPTESQRLERRPELYRFCEELGRADFERLGFEVEVHDNPIPERGPFLIATRIEDPGRPTLLTYGHADVVTAFEEEWREGLDPWTLKEEGDLFYGRGTVDDKGQVLLALSAHRAVIEERGGRLGFNAKFLVETGEEQGSPGLERFLREHAGPLAADAMIWCDGPRLSLEYQELDLGNRGGVMFDLIVDLKREGGLHSGHWGGVMPDAGIILAQALATITTPKGKILVDGWLPKSIPESVREATRALRMDPVPGLPAPDPEWGEPGLTPTEKTMAWTSFIVLAFRCGNPDNPVNSVPSYAKARCQVRHTADVPRAVFIPALRRHLDAHGFEAVEIRSEVERGQFPAARTDPGDPWVAWCAASVERTAGKPPLVVPNSPGSNPMAYFQGALGVPGIKIPHGHKGCKQHGPDEHGLKPVFREGLGVMAGLYWDLGEPDTPKRDYAT